MIEYEQTLSPQNIEAELCYAYVHAVAAFAGVECHVSGRISDNRGIDARLHSRGPFADDVRYCNAQIEVQLKATTAELATVGSAIAYPLKNIRLYNDYRHKASIVPRIVVVLVLPDEQSRWLSHSARSLAIRQCAYWVSLRGAAETVNTKSQTIYVPKHQHFNPKALKDLMNKVAAGRFPEYKESTR